MGKSLKGRELGVGLSQRKDGTYSARFVERSGHRIEKYFKTLPEARNWLADRRYADAHADVLPEDTTVDQWFNFWQDTINRGLAPNTLRNYRERYEKNIKSFIGGMMLKDVKPMHCKMIFNAMEDAGYAGSTIHQTYVCIGVFFRAAIQNGKAVKHPLDGVRLIKPIRAVDDIRFLSVSEQEAFLSAAALSHNYAQYALILETGLRTGELIGLTWDNINWEKKTLSVRKSLEYRHSTGQWRAGPPKSASSYREIPLTSKALSILKDVYATRRVPKRTDVLTYTDRRDGQTKSFSMKDLVFINFRTGEPSKNSSYDTHLYKICDKAGIERFSMHALRHTFATRAIERGVHPKVLQKILGHSSLKITMDRYVHVSEESMTEAFRIFEEAKMA